MQNRLRKSFLSQILKMSARWAATTILQEQISNFKRCFRVYIQCQNWLSLHLGRICRLFRVERAMTWKPQLYNIRTRARFRRLMLSSTHAVFLQPLTPIWKDSVHNLSARIAISGAFSRPSYTRFCTHKHIVSDLTCSEVIEQSI